MSSSHPVSLRVNDRRARADVEARTTLADLLRDDLGYTSVHLGCEQGVCGACTVLLDGAPVRSCLVFGVQADGADVVTLEGLAPPGGLHPLQEAFRDSHGFQCGFCTPGFVLSAYALLAEEPAPSDATIRAALAGHLCRCTGYQSIVEGVALAAARLAGRPLPAPGTAGRSGGSGESGESGESGGSGR